MVVIKDAGAYGAVMASCYNTRPLIPEVLVTEDTLTVIRPRPSYEDLINMDTPVGITDHQPPGD